MDSGKMWQLKEVDRIAVVNLTKSGFRIYLQNLTASAVGATSETTE